MKNGTCPRDGAVLNFIVDALEELAVVETIVAAVILDVESCVSFLFIVGKDAAAADIPLLLVVLKALAFSSIMDFRF